MLAIALGLLAVPGAEAQALEVAPFAGLQYGGSFESVAGERAYLDASAAFGGTLDFAVGRDWRIEILYSRQSTELQAASPAQEYGVRVERYMAGLMQELGESPTRFFGVVLLGATRFVPAPFGTDSTTRFSAGLGFGVKRYVSKRVGFRAEARALFAVVESGGGLVCGVDVCLFRFHGSGVWQGDVSAAVVIRF